MATRWVCTDRSSLQKVSFNGIVLHTCSVLLGLVIPIFWLWEPQHKDWCVIETWNCKLRTVGSSACFCNCQQHLCCHRSHKPHHHNIIISVIIFTVSSALSTTPPTTSFFSSSSPLADRSPCRYRIARAWYYYKNDRDRLWHKDHYPNLNSKAAPVTPDGYKNFDKLDAVQKARLPLHSVTQREVDAGKLPALGPWTKACSSCCRSYVLAPCVVWHNVRLRLMA